MKSIRIAQEHYDELMTHLYPGDGMEAVAFALCGQSKSSKRTTLLVHKVICIPYELCIERTPNTVTWRSELLPKMLSEARKNKWGVIKFHSHPSNVLHFSDFDNESDLSLFPRIYDWLNTDINHASVIVGPDGDMQGRIVSKSGNFYHISNIWLAGDDIRLLSSNSFSQRNDAPSFSERIQQTFGEKTFEILQGLTVGVVGCSGTGGPVIEQLTRNGVGELVLVDPDRIDHGNLNRIPYSTLSDAENNVPKVAMFKKAIENIGLGTTVDARHSDIFNRDVIKRLSDCDILIGCMDTVDGRHLLNKLATFYLIPYFDLGVKLVADGQGGISEVCTQHHYLLPGASLLSRGVYDIQGLQASSLYRTDPEGYKEFRQSGYISGVNINRPAVASVNSTCVSIAINDLLARLHPYRNISNKDTGGYRVSLSHMRVFQIKKSDTPCSSFSKYMGLGDVEPLLYDAELSTHYEEVNAS